MNGELKVVYTTTDPNTAEILRGALQGEGIKCEIEGENQGGFTGMNFSEIRLVVRAEDYDRAHNFVKSHESHESDEEESDESSD